MISATASTVVTTHEKHRQYKDEWRWHMCINQRQHNVDGACCFVKWTGFFPWADYSRLEVSMFASEQTVNF